MFFKKINKIKIVVQNQTKSQQNRAIDFFSQLKNNIDLKMVVIWYFLTKIAV